MIVGKNLSNRFYTSRSKNEGMKQKIITGGTILLGLITEDEAQVIIVNESGSITSVNT